ncbi:MAG: primosomal protein N' (replication factor Y) [Hyphomicrobiaceae bacterium]|jgi:primosomal protein N' (replication factor Y)
MPLCSPRTLETFATVTPLPPIPDIDTLTYAVPEALDASVQPGVRVVVPLGPRRVTALVITRTGEAPEGMRLREIASVLDDTPIVPADLLGVVDWMAEYYLCSRADVLSLAIGRGLTTASRREVRLLTPDGAKSKPESNVIAALAAAGGALSPMRLAAAVGLRSVDRTLSALRERKIVDIADVLDEPKVKPRFETRASIVRMPDEALSANLFRRAPKRREIYEYLHASPTRSATLAELAEMFPSPKATLGALEEAGIVKLTREESYRAISAEIEVAQAVALNPAQQVAVDAVTAKLGTFSPFLLFGVTSSGKTEIYLRLIREALDQQRSALVLVPEISLTHQIVARLRGRFGDEVAVLHSELSPGERWDQWRRIARGEARVAVGARSAVLAPLTDVGIVIVDEEHDSSYKQGDGVRYHARDVAVLRGREANCPVVLGSATPSMESWRHARSGRYDLLRLPERATPTPLPIVEVVDLRSRDIVALGGLGEHLGERVKRNVKAGGQTLLFLNRRGFAASLQCYECGKVLECSHCSVAMTVHRHENVLRCHHCDARQALPDRCQDCGRDALVSQGLGTQRLEATVRALVPGARVARLDRDATSRKGLSEKILRQWRNGELDVLIGTQMITKGHDVAGVNLVGVIHADQSLLVPDFRAGERTFALLCQVAGRAGRGEEPGHVIVQTYQPQNPAIQAAVHHDFETFAEAELSDRAELGYPPHERIVVMRFEGASRSSVERIADMAAREVAAIGAEGLRWRGPGPALVERVKERFRFKLELQAGGSNVLRAVAAQTRDRISDAARKASVRVAIDVDPQDLV